MAARNTNTTLGFVSIAAPGSSYSSSSSCIRSQGIALCSIGSRPCVVFSHNRQLREPRISRSRIYSTAPKADARKDDDDDDDRLEEPSLAELKKESKFSVMNSDDEEVTFDAVAARVAEVKEVMDGLIAFRQRIIDDATNLAKKVKASPAKLQQTLENHPDILKIDASLKQLEKELARLESSF